TERSQVLAIKCGRGSQNQTLRAGNRIDRAVVQPIHPWNGRPVIKARDKFSAKIDAARSTSHDTYETRFIRYRHKIDDCCAAALDNKWAGPIAPAYRHSRSRRGDEPTPVFGSSNERGKAR